MKKLLLTATTLCFVAVSFAQKSQIRTAKNYLADKNYEKAKSAIEEAVTNDDTKNDPYAWYTRGLVYLAMQGEPANATKDYYQEAGKSFKKAISLKPDYETEDVNNKLFAVAIYNFNAGLMAFDKQNYEGSYNSFGEVTNIQGLDNGKRYGGKSWVKFDTMARQASLYQGYSAYYANKFDEALPLLLKAKNDPAVRAYNIYLMLADIYEAKQDEANLMAILDEGKKQFPNEKTLVNRELNAYIKANKSDQLVAKLEEAIKSEPNNADFLFTLGIAYDNMANPKDAKGNELPKPANYADVFGKAEQAYKNALQASDKADINYNLGALYFNRAVLVNEQMNAISGTSAADIKKYDGLKAQRDDWFGKALPYLEKTIAQLDPNASTLKGEDKNTYIGALMAAKEISAKLNKLDKATEYKKKLEAITK
ncbi:MAG: tetratricopeptide repeat protein [Bacteroidetes bacterium]|nr:tetratricopeptide repeat protein [Bacteroidota bacterium]MBS1740676.1 tetratricopeptide repeat protein [Bacteroidota bacterium]